MKPTFSAILIGSRVSRRGEALRVLSVHSTATYLISQTGERVVSVIARAADMSPTGICLESSYHRFRRLLLERNTSCAGRISPAVLSGDTLNVQMSGARSWSGEPDYAAIRIRQRTIREVEVLLAQITRGLCGLFAYASPDAATESVRQTLSFARRQPGPACSTAMVEGLIGLGRGLTPSGDDFLSGAMLADDLTRAGCIEHAPPPLDLNRLCHPHRTAQSTTPISATMLGSSAAGSYPAYLLEIVRLLAEPADAAAAAGRAAEFGATSGLDTLSGLCWALSRNDYHAT